MKKKKTAIISIFLLIVLSFIPNYLWAEENITEDAQKLKKDIFEEISAPNLLLIETKTGQILYQRNIEATIYPASLTKLMTAILVVEHCELDDIVTVSENAVRSVPSGYVNANLQVGEELTVEDLLYVMLIPSANDAANALAEHVGGNIESFASMMNTRAKELGCTGSNFTNPSGLHQEEHYTTTKDLYVIAKEAIAKPIIKKIIGTTTYSLPDTNMYTKTRRIFTSTNYMKLKSMPRYYCDYCIGGKTGYTGEAKNCVVEFAENNAIELTAIVMGETASVKGKKFEDAKKMLDYAFSHYEKKQVARQNEIFETITIENGTKETKKLDVLYQNDITFLQLKGDKKEIQKEMNYYVTKAPIQKGELIGKIVYSYDGTEYSTPLIAKEAVIESKTTRNLFILVLLMLFIVILYRFQKSNRKRKRHGKRK